MLVATRLVQTPAAIIAYHFEAKIGPELRDSLTQDRRNFVPDSQHIIRCTPMN